MEKGKKPKHFLNQPVFPGGPKALTQFIYANLRYPESAAESGTEGMVVIEYDINHQGVVTVTRVLQGLGADFDEEARRVVKLLRFDVAKNRGLRVIFHQKAYIEFKKPLPLPKPVEPPVFSMQYVVVAEAAPKPAAEVYTYTVSL